MPSLVKACSTASIDSGRQLGSRQPGRDLVRGQEALLLAAGDEVLDLVDLDLARECCRAHAAPLSKTTLRHAHRAELRSDDRTGDGPSFEPVCLVLIEQCSSQRPLRLTGPPIACLAQCPAVLLERKQLARQLVVVVGLLQRIHPLQARLQLVDAAGTPRAPAAWPAASTRSAASTSRSVRIGSTASSVAKPLMKSFGAAEVTA